MPTRFDTIRASLDGKFRNSLPARGVYSSVMACKKWIFRILRVAGLAALAVVLLTFITVQFQQRLLRYHAERLMADMHQIRLYQSTWADAQKLMYRWGAWGHYDGSCTAERCLYRIEMTDLSWASASSPKSVWVEWLLLHDTLNLYSWLGGRRSKLFASFNLHDGKIWRESAGIGVAVPTKPWEMSDAFGYTLIVDTKSRQRLRQTRDGWWILGTEDQLAEHPYYKAGRPGGCTFCQEAVVTYSTHTPQTEIKSLTSFDFSCLTRPWFHSCTTIEEILPAARPWHLYDDVSPDYRPPQPTSSAPKPCNIPIWALARDAPYVLSVEALSQTLKRTPGDDREAAPVKIVASLKGTAPWISGTVVQAQPYSGCLAYPPFEEPEHLLPGKHYIVFPVGMDRKDDPVLTSKSPLDLRRCGVQPDTPEVRRELEKGFAQNDNLRGPELR